VGEAWDEDWSKVESYFADIDSTFNFSLRGIIETLFREV
jgi:hypothetical protein